MNQIDWGWLVVTLLCTGALGIALSVLGFARVRARQVEQATMKILTQPDFGLGLIIGSALFLSGIIFSTATLGLKIILGICTIRLVIELIRSMNKIHA